MLRRSLLRSAVFRCGLCAAFLASAVVVPAVGPVTPASAQSGSGLISAPMGDGDLRPRGAWSASTSYVLNDIVTSRG
jgi:hypothetical protein